MVVHSKFLEPGNKSSVFAELCARYKGSDRGPLGSRSSDLSLYLRNLNSLKFQTCDSTRCKTCPSANADNITRDAKLNTFCKVYNCIYKLTCTICGIAYIGQTSNPLHKRINLHRSCVNNYNVSDNNINFEYQHFNLHGFSNILIDVLAIMPRAQERLFLESQFIKFYNTSYPYGLNQMIYNKHLQLFPSNLMSYHPVYNTLNLSLYSKTQRNRRGGNKKCAAPPPLEIKRLILHHQTQFFKDFNWKNIRKFIFSIKKKHIHSFITVFQNLSINNHFSHTFFDLITARAQMLNLNLSTNKSVHKDENTQFIINFTNPVFNRLNFNHILNNKDNPFPLTTVQISKTFKYPLCLGRKIFNYNSFAKSCNAEDNHPCFCNEERFKDFINTDHGHIITGNLNIVDNIYLRKLMSLGTKFRLPNNHSFNSILTKFKYDIDFFIYKIAIKYNKPVEYFDFWKYNTITYFKHQLKNLNFSYNFYNTLHLKTHIKNLQNKFIITYVDKAPNNYAIICKSYYQKMLNHSLLDSEIFKMSSTKIEINNRKILKYHKLLNITCKNFNYPYIVLIPKFHKAPIKFRMVTVGCNAYNNVAGKVLLNILNQISIFTRSDDRISINNSFDLKYKLNVINNVTQLKTYDFKDLFNSIQISDLHRVINLLYLEYFSKNNVSTDEVFFKRLLNFILHNNFIIFGKDLYSQVLGIPQGGCASSMLANLYLFYYERNFQHNNVFIYRYIDDVILVSNTSQLHSLPPLNFYPSYLELVDNVLNDHNSVNFLDLSITINSGGSLSFDVYDKRKDFSFHVNSFSNFRSCLHISVFRNILINLRNRILHLCSEFNISRNLHRLADIAIKEHYPYNFVTFHLSPKNF